MSTDEGRSMESQQPLHERLILLLEEEEPAVRAFLTEAITLAQDSRVSAEGLTVKLQRKLPDQWDSHED
jgi:hypothetical protein